MLRPILSVLLALGLTIPFAACGGDGSDAHGPQSQSAAGTIATQTAAVPADEPVAAKLDGVAAFEGPSGWPYHRAPDGSYGGFTDPSEPISTAATAPPEGNRVVEVFAAPFERGGRTTEELVRGEVDRVEHHSYGQTTKKIRGKRFKREWTVIDGAPATSLEDRLGNELTITTWRNGKKVTITGRGGKGGIKAAREDAEIVRASWRWVSGP